MTQSTAKRARVDKLLVDQGLVASRDRARRLILAGEVWAGSRRIDKAGTELPIDTALEVRGGDIPYVSRGGLKLEAALSHWNLDVAGTVALDIGASTGGFTDCLLQHGAAKVIAIDVGYGQFAWALRQDPRVVLFERANIRQFQADRLPELANLAVVDVSFISLLLVIHKILELLHPEARLLALVKPQFEVGKGEVGKGGVVRDEAARLATVAAVKAFGQDIGLTNHGDFLCPIPGPKGNREYFLNFTRSKIGTSSTPTENGVSKQ